VNTNQLLKRLAAETPSAGWAAKAFAKYLITDFDILSYFFSSDVDPEQNAADSHDRVDDLLLLTPGALTFYRMITKGLRAPAGETQIESQRLEKSVLPLTHLANVHMVWESRQAFAGDAPDHDPRLHLSVTLDIEMPPLGREITLPYRDDEADRDADSVRHQVETFGEALLLELNDELAPVITVDQELLSPEIENGASSPERL
jgi:hypothetical protein